MCFQKISIFTSDSVVYVTIFFPPAHTDTPNTIDKLEMRSELFKVAYIVLENRALASIFLK